MSEPKRLKITGFGWPSAGIKDESEWVGKEDYDNVVSEVKRLKDAYDNALAQLNFSNGSDLYEENVRLKSEVDMWKRISTDNGVACNERARENQDLENQIERLKSENERLSNEEGKRVEEVREYFLKFCNRLIDERSEQYRDFVVERAKAIGLEDKINRLCKAGDLIKAHLLTSAVMYERYWEAMAQWNYAKNSEAK